MFQLPRGLKLNPFSTSDDPKLAFRSTILPQLWTRHVATTETAIYASFWTTFDTSYDVGNLLTFGDYQKILHTQPDNFKNLIKVLCGRLFEIIQDDDFPSKKSESKGINLADYRPNFLGTGASQALTTPNLTKELLNCLRVLSRLIPIVLSLEDATTEQELFWKPTQLPSAATPKRQSAISEEAGHFVIDDEEDGDGDDVKANTTKSFTKDAQNAEKLRPLAEVLITTSVDLLFYTGFTLPDASTSAKDKKVNYAIWENGIGSTTSVISSKSADSNRIEVLRFLLVLLSKTLYIPPAVYYNASSNIYDTSSVNRWLLYLTHLPSSSSAADKQRKKVMLSLLCSLLNTYLKSGAHFLSSSSHALNIVGDVVNDSYEKLLSGGKKKGDSTKLILVKLCIQVIGVLVGSCGLGMSSDALPTILSPPQSPGRNIGNLSFNSALSISTDAPKQFENAFTFYLSKLHRSSDLSFIAENLLTILLQPMNSSLLKMPFEVVGIGSTLSNPTSLAIDSLTLLWKLIECNSKFVAHLLDTPKKVHQVAGVLLYYCLEYKDDPAQLGLVKLSAFILQTVSAQRSFGTALAEPLDNTVPISSKWAVPGTAADFLIQNLYTLIFSTKGALNAIYPAFILTLTNISPFLKNPSIRSSTRLVQLFLAMSTPNFLLSDEANPRLVFYLLEMFNNVIHYQLSACPHLIYAIIRSHQRFSELANFTCASGVASIRRARKERMTGTINNSSTASLGGTKTPRRMSSVSERSLAPTLTSSLGSESTALPAVEDQEKAALMENDQKEEERRAGSQPNSPAAEYPPRHINVGGVYMSEKAAGKQRARSDSQDRPYGDTAQDAAADDDPDTTPWVSKNGFQPTETWVASWREGLPIDAILILISECLSKVSSLSSLSSSNTSALEYLKSVNLVGLLPPAPPLRARPFVHSVHSLLWLSSLTWGNVYVQSLENSSQFAVWANTNIRLFNVKQKENSGVQAAVTNLVGQSLGILNLGSSSPMGVASPPRAGRTLSGGVIPRDRRASGGAI